MKSGARVLLWCTCIWGPLWLTVLLRPGRRWGHEKMSSVPVMLQLYLRTPMSESPVATRQKMRSWKVGFGSCYAAPVSEDPYGWESCNHQAEEEDMKSGVWFLFMLYLYLRTPMAESPVETRQKTRPWKVGFESCLCCTCIWGPLKLRVLLQPGRRWGLEKWVLGPVMLHLYLRTPMAESPVTTRQKKSTWKVGFGSCLCCTCIWGPLWLRVL